MKWRVVLRHLVTKEKREETVEAVGSLEAWDLVKVNYPDADWRVSHVLPAEDSHVTVLES